jgi:hypothetical protein
LIAAHSWAKQRKSLLHWHYRRQGVRRYRIIVFHLGSRSVIWSRKSRHSITVPNAYQASQGTWKPSNWLTLMIHWSCPIDWNILNTSTTELWNKRLRYASFPIIMASSHRVVKGQVWTTFSREDSLLDAKTDDFPVEPVQLTEWRSFFGWCSNICVASSLITVELTLKHCWISNNTTRGPDNIWETPNLGVITGSTFVFFFLRLERLCEINPFLSDPSTECSSRSSFYWNIVRYTDGEAVLYQNENLCTKKTTGNTVAVCRQFWVLALLLRNAASLISLLTRC